MSKTRLSSLRSLCLRFWRLGLLALAVFLIRQAATKQAVEEAGSQLVASRLRDFFPDAASLGEANSVNGWRPVLDAQGQALGYAATTAPESAKIIGYAGPTHCLLAFDPKGVLKGLRILRSHDTEDHVAEVVADRRFFVQFQGLKPDSPPPAEIHMVAGATLTSSAIAQGVLEKLGRSAAASLRFPEDITLEEVSKLEPKAASLQPAPGRPGGYQVLDAAGQVVGLAVRTSPVTDTLVGYKGPTDTLMLLDPQGTTLRRMAVRKSFDTKRYTAYVTGDDYFLNLFNDMPLEKLATLDFAAAKIEGVSGATETSWAVAEGLKRTAAHLLEQEPAGWLRQVRWRWQDGGHLAVILSACLMAFTRLRGRAWARHGHHALLVVYAGFVSGELLSQGLLTGWAAHGTPWRGAPGLLLLAGVALLAPVFTSRQLYCHHICPHGAFQQLLAHRLPWQARLPAKLDRALGVLPYVLLAFVLTTVIAGWRVNLNALEPFDAYLFRIAGTASLVLAGVGLLASLFTPLAYCKYGCPTGALFKLLRFTGHGDRLGLRDWLAALALGLAALV